MTQENQHRSDWKWFRVGGTIAGGIMILSAFLADKIGFSAPGNFSTGQILLALLGFLLLLVGLLGSRFPNFYKGAALIILNTVILFLFMELISTIIIKLQDKFLKPSNPASLLPYYASQDWSTAFWQEWDEFGGRKIYFPWVVWRGGPFESSTININQDGIRQTPGADCVPGSYKVFTFGGSTMWGIGSPDWGTIAAYLQADLASGRNQPVCTTNFGEIGYVSTQELIEMMKQLQKGNIPDLVIFYDGVNDVYAAYQSGQACVHQDLSYIASKYNNQDVHPADQTIKRIENSHTFQLFKTLVGKLANTNQKVIDYQTMGIGTDSLADSIVKCYFGNYQIVDGLAHVYGFDYAFFWQPSILTGNKQLTSYEQHFRLSWDPAFRDLLAATYPKVMYSTLEHNNFYDIADVYDEQVTDIYIDEAHVTPVGNQLVATEMLQKLGYQPTGKK